MLRAMAEPGLRQQLTPVTVLFADISASTTLYAQRGDATAFGLASQCLAVVERGDRGGRRARAEAAR